MSWKWVDDQIAILADLLRDQPIKYVSGIPRGGLIPAIMLSHKLGAEYLPFDKLQIAYKISRNQEKNNEVLLVDDISDTGVTMNGYSETFLTATLCVRFDSQTMPDVFGEKINDDRWLVFPWEQNNSKPIQDYLDNWQ